MRHFGNIGAVFETFIQNHVHQAQCQRRVSPWTNGDVPVSHGRSTRAVRIDDDQARAVAPRFLNERPQVNVVAVNVRAPSKDELRQPHILCRRAVLLAVDQVPRLPASLRANGAVELASAKAVKEAAIHRSIAEHADGAGVAVGQN